MLDVTNEDGIEDPIESDHNVHYHRGVVDPDPAESKDLSKERILGIGVAQAPIHDQIPDRRVDSIQQAEGDESCLETRVFVNAVHAQGHIVEDTEHILPQIQQMRECVSGVSESTDTLEGSPYRGKRGEEPEKSGMRRIARGGIAPMRGIKAEEELDVLKVYLVMRGDRLC